MGEKCYINVVECKFWDFEKIDGSKIFFNLKDSRKLFKFLNNIGSCLFVRNLFKLLDLNWWNFSCFCKFENLFYIFCYVSEYF